MEIADTGNGTPAFVVQRNGGESITTTVAHVDSITWLNGFVYENAEVFDLNDSTLTVNAHKCSVSMSPTTIDTDVQLCIRNAVLTPNVIENCVRGLAIDISLSNDVHELNGTADITIPVTHGKDEKVQAAYFNEESGEWEPVYFRYDKDKEAVVITTDHLSTFSVFVVKDDNNSRSRLGMLYDECPAYLDLNQALGKMYSIISSDNPDEESIQAWRDDYGFWQSVGLDGGYSMLSSLGFTTEAVSNAVDVVGYLGTATTILDVISADIKGDNLGTASNTLKAILGFASGQMTSAVGTSIMQASMGVAAFIGVALEKFGTKVQESKKNLFDRAYRFYYSDASRNLVGANSNFGSKYYRTERDWYEYFYPAFISGMKEENLRAYIEQSVRRYCDRFWEDSYEVYNLCMAEKDVHSISTYMYPDPEMMQEISDVYYADLFNGVLPKVFHSIKMNLAVQSKKRHDKAMRDYLAIINTNIGIRITDSSWKEGETSKYAGWKICFSDMPASLEDPERLQSTISENGRATIGYFTAYALIKNNIRCQLTLINPDGEEKGVYEFKIPASTGKVVCNIDLATGQSTTIVPHLANLELEYDPNSILVESTWYQRGVNDPPAEDEDIHPTGGSVIYLSNTAGDNKTRFQTEIEKFFYRHDFIVVDHIGNIRIGDDIVGKFEESGLQGKGKFTLNVTYPFVKRTLKDFHNSINSKNFFPYILFSGRLLNGTIQHKIDCQFTVSRSTNSEEFFVSYTGTGTYTLNAEVIDEIYHVYWYDTDIDFSDTKLEDIYTRQIEAEGTVKLKYKTKLK